MKFNINVVLNPQFYNKIYDNIIYVLVALIILLLITFLFSKLRIRLGIIKRLDNDSYRHLKTVPAKLLLIFFILNIIIFFYQPNFSRLELLRLTDKNGNISDFFSDKLVKYELDATARVTNYEYYKYYDIMFIIELFCCIVIFYMIIMKILFDIDFV